ncbi:hypothetical protein [Schaalia hyovaginalis]|uniref:Nuclear transport factor 2 family protein n=1 Tax=Schaalia hyovaginalis TaxID=29316 RepID=A0A923IZ99_9ACTO|nr:hypothetical protein [Schaalia hyovaginalis]MBB6335136.1 hypothetical protein [Schaalia hyovaginalis]
MSRKFSALFAAAGLAIAACLAGCAHEPTAADKTPEGVEVAVRETYDMVRNGPVLKETWEKYCADYITEASRSLVTICEHPYDDSGAARDEIIRISNIQIVDDHASVDVDVQQHLYPGHFQTWHEEFEWEEGRWKRVATGQY